ncbi:MAG: tetratricopeptide repeat protein, partial [bacterium]
ALRELDALYRDESLGIEGSPKFCTAGAIFAFEKGEEELARERFDHCLEAFPTSSIVLSKAVEFFDDHREPARSLEILETALEQEPESQSLRDRIAARLGAMNRIDDARDLLTEATGLESPVARIRAWVSLAAFESSMGEPMAAASAYEKAIELSSTPSPDLEFGYADALIQAGRFEEAYAWADRLTVAPHRSLIKGRALLGQGEPERALQHLGEGNRLWPNNAVARYYTAVAAERAGELDRAIEEYRYAIRADAPATDAGIRLASYYVALGEDERAISILSLAARDNREAMTMQLMAVRLMAKLGIWNQAPQPLVSALAHPALVARAATAIAEGILERDGPEEAVAYLEKTRLEKTRLEKTRLEKTRGLNLTAPRNAIVLSRLVQWLPRIGRAQDALAMARRASAAHPDEAVFQTLHALALESTEAEPERVIAVYERAIEMDAQQPLALRGLARMLDRKNEGESESGEDARIVDLYRRAVALNPRDDRAALELATWLVEQDRTDEASETLEALLREQPWNAEASLALAELQVATDAGPAARERASELLERTRRLQSGEAGLEPRIERLRAQLDPVAGERLDRG